MLEARQELLRVLIRVVGVGDSVRQFAGGVDIAADNISYCHAALESALPAGDYRADLVVVREMLAVNDCAGVEDYDCVRERRSDAVDETLLCVRKVVVAGNSLSVNALCGEAAESNYSNICVRGCLRYELVGHMRLGNMHAREGVVDYIVFLFAEGHGVDLVPYLLDLGAGRDALARLLDIFFVELDGRLEHTDLAL